MGRIGMAVARRAHFGFAMPIVFHSHDPVPEHGIPGARRVDSIEQVLREADFVSLHPPGRPQNVHLIDAARLSLMKPDAFLINTARGDLVDQEALLDALRSGAIAGAGLDVYDGEPVVPEELRRLDNVVLLPHLGSATLETRIAMGMCVLDNLAAFMAGVDPPCRVW
jgi:lactate dehydrogenase-like 2-hydroxyacid dehydrogenase